MHFLKKGQKIRAGVDPSPPYSGNARKKTFFSIDVFPKEEIILVKLKWKGERLKKIPEPRVTDIQYSWTWHNCRGGGTLLGGGVHGQMGGFKAALLFRGRPSTLTALSIECKYFNQALPYAHGQMNAITSSKALSSIVVVILSLTRNLG